jgi:hypothetical protein
VRSLSVVLSRPMKSIVVAAFVVALLLVGAGVASAQTVLPPTICPTNFGSCTANDMVTGVSNAIPVGGDTCTDPGDTITVDLFVSFDSTAARRYDVGFWIATDGGSVNNGTACIGSTAPIGIGTPPFLDLDSGSQPGDTCGDVENGATTDPVVWPIRATLPCTPAPGTDFLQVQTCTAWQQNTGITCTGLTDAGTGAKCFCGPLPVTQVPVPRAATVTVIKDIVPNTDTEGRFNLFIDEGNNGSNDHEVLNVGDNGQLGPHIVPAGTQALPGATHEIGETAGTGTNLANYNTSITCTEAGGGSVGPVSGTSTLLTVQPNSNWTCTITNTAKPATITVKKVAVNTAGQPYCPGRVFGFTRTAGVNFTLTSNLCADSPEYTAQVTPGNYTIAETDGDINVPPNGWTLESIVCTGTALDATNWVRVLDAPAGLGPEDRDISGYLGANETIECVFTNRQDSALAVNIAGFTAAAAPQGVTLAWETVSETSNAGFNVYRSESDAGPWTQVNAVLIPAKAPGSAEGQAYTWTDASAEAGMTYFYQLEDVALSGETTRHDPVSVALMGPNAVGLAGFGAAATTSAPALAGLAGIALAALAGAGLRRRR